MPRTRTPKYATEEERKAARRETYKKSQKKHRDEKGRPSRKGFKEWPPSFVGLDGESFVTDELLPDGTPKQAYALLLRSDKKPIFNEEGLSTWHCLQYLTDNPPRKTALVGFFLNFDFEWILKDVTQAQYKALQHGEQVELFNGEYYVQWFVGKKLVIHRLKHSSRLKPKEERKTAKDYSMTTFQDVQGFFQQSFVGALKKWGFGEDPRLEIITSGKAARGGFEFENIKDVMKYNAMEMELLEELMTKLFESFRAAYLTAGLQFRVNSNSWSGPGVFANDFLKQTKWNEEHPQPNEYLKKKYRRGKSTDYGNAHAYNFPFSLGYYGGRIELAIAGKFFGGAWNGDINSAYPYALSLLPKWNPEDFKTYGYLGGVLTGAKELLDRRLMGLYKIRFNFSKGWTWYPFPVRDTQGGSPNVFYPRHGVTHVMSAELFAVLDTLPEEELRNVSIIDAFVLETTDGYGDALNRMPEEQLSTTAKETLKMADVRLESKAASQRLEEGTEREGDGLLATAEKALKLILNSLYGKTVQQIGSHKYYNDFASAWITSVCRALIWRAIAPERSSDKVIMIMTDGVYSQTPLKFATDRISSVLGEWEQNKFSYFETFKAGVYRYEKKGKMNYKVRGFLTPTDEDRAKLFDLTDLALRTGTVSKFPARQFITRNLALEGWGREPYLRQFYNLEKDIKAELKAKRDPVEGSWIIPDGRPYLLFPPKRSGDGVINESRGYALNFEETLDPESEEDVEEFLLKYDSTIGLEESYFD